MKKSLKLFFEDYYDLCKQSNQWMKKHWKGYLVLCASIWGGTYAYLRHQEKKRDEEAKKPTQLETIESQVMYTALMTDTMLEE